MQPMPDLLPHLSARITVRGRRGIFTISYLSHCPEVLYILPPPTREDSLAVYMHCCSSQKDQRWWSNPGDNTVKWVSSLRQSETLLWSSGYPEGHQEAKSFLRRLLRRSAVCTSSLVHWLWWPWTSSPFLTSSSHKIVHALLWFTTWQNTAFKDMDRQSGAKVLKNTI